jgi:hypothetical protein
VVLDGVLLRFGFETIRGGARVKGSASGRVVIGNERRLCHHREK